jgi:hypothetical protein
MSFWKGDAIAQGLEGAIRAGQDQREAESALVRTQNLAKRIDALENANAANLAEKHALRAALKRIEPNHPLLTNASLQERIKEAGKRAIAITSDFDSAREAGESFKYD